ncbi:MAG TPA: threonine/serine dehydratase [Gemmatimonadaceae bacterium]|nr:threonine/serine dehydratase [Gemmatimonadaceae bacterium]
MSDAGLVALEDVRAAGRAIAGRVRRTPMMRSTQLSARLGVDLQFKLELFQKTGSFKVRGALNRMLKLSADERRRGVVTISAGNHAQAVAWGAREVGTRALVVMYAGAVKSKVEATRGYGGEVIQSDRDLLDVAHELQEERNLVMVHPFDDPAVIAGAGTVGDEILDDAPEADAILVGVGGGGIVSGIAVAAKARRAGIRVIGVEPEGAAAMRLSLDRGSPQKLERVSTIADGLAAPWAGALTFAHVCGLGIEIVTVPDAAIAESMWLTIERCKVLAEPAAAAGMAALVAGAVSLPQGARAVCVLTGGNVDRERLKSLA